MCMLPNVTRRENKLVIYNVDFRKVLQRSLHAGSIVYYAILTNLFMNSHGYLMATNPPKHDISFYAES